MGFTTLSREEKERIIRALESDREFRYALMGLLGFKELLERFAKLEERFARLEERFTRIEERFIKLEERQQKLEERQQALEEEMRLVIDKLIELSETVERIRRSQELMAMELGALAESTYCRFLLDDLVSEIESEGDRVILKRRNARVNGEDIDLLIETLRKVYVVEVKVKPKASDVGKLIAKAEIVGRRYEGKEVIPLLVGALIGADVESYALSKGVKVYAY